MPLPRRADQVRLSGRHTRRQDTIAYHLLKERKKKKKKKLKTGAYTRTADNANLKRQLRVSPPTQTSSEIVYSLRVGVKKPPQQNRSRRSGHLMVLAAMLPLSDLLCGPPNLIDFVVRGRNKGKESCPRHAGKTWSQQ